MKRTIWVLLGAVLTILGCEDGSPLDDGRYELHQAGDHVILLDTRTGMMNRRSPAHIKPAPFTEAAEACEDGGHRVVRQHCVFSRAAPNFGGTLRGSTPLVGPLSLESILNATYYVSCIGAGRTWDQAERECEDAIE